VGTLKEKIRQTLFFVKVQKVSRKSIDKSKSYHKNPLKILLQISFKSHPISYKDVFFRKNVVKNEIHTNGRI